MMVLKAISSRPSARVHHSRASSCWRPSAAAVALLPACFTSWSDIIEVLHKQNEVFWIPYLTKYKVCYSLYVPVPCVFVTYSMK